MTTAELITTSLAKTQLTIVVTDSGLGGLAVAAQLVEALRTQRSYQSVRIIFFNALFDDASGYNRLASQTERARVFDQVLESIATHYQPDFILIACNTLSVVYPETRFASQTTIPVIGIVEAGAQLIAENLQPDPSSKVLIFATVTTVNSDFFPQRLAALGIDPARVMQQPCPALAGSIERDWNSDETRRLIDEYVAEALYQLNDATAPLFVSLNCTHYAYAQAHWQTTFNHYQRPPQTILNPDAKMLAFITATPWRDRFPISEVRLEVVSKVEISESKVHALAQLLQTSSLPTVIALRQYTWNEHLF